MKVNELAINGGKPIIDKEFKRYNPLGKEEVMAVNKVMESGVLSDFYGTKGDFFLGGKNVKEFEKNICDFYSVKYAVTFNSWTSGLIAAVGALELSPGDEVIVPTWTMCATATAVLHWNAIPIFADIEKESFNIDPISIEKNISEKTKAIIAVDIFGLPANLKKIKQICNKYNLKLINDSAQSPTSKIDSNYVGSESDIGGFSLNYHKHFHTGEGGILITNNEKIYNKACLIRNHGEACIDIDDNLTNVLGFNFRMGEIEAAIGIQQLKKINKLVEIKINLAERLIEGLKKFNGIATPKTPDNYTHSYYVLPLILDVKTIGIDRKTITEALIAEGVPVSSGYQNIHMLPIYQNKIAFGDAGFPWNYKDTRKNISYKKGICPVAEELHEETFFFIPICSYELFENDVDKILEAFNKVWQNLRI